MKIMNKDYHFVFVVVVLLVTRPQSVLSGDQVLHQLLGYHKDNFIDKTKK